MRRKNSSAIRLLLVEENMQPELPEAYELVRLSDRGQLEKEAAGLGADVIISGKIPGYRSTFETLDAVMRTFATAPVIALVEDESEGKTALSRGAAGSLIRGSFDDASLHAQVAYVLEKGAPQRCSLDDVGRAAHVLAHDIRNSLSSILLSMDRIRQTHADDEETIFYLNIMDRAAQNVSRVISKFSIATGSMEAKTKNENLVALVKKVIAGFVVQHGNKPRITESFSVPEIRMPLDPDKMETAIYNLLLNAREACETKDEITVQLQLADGMAVLRVLDKGKGMTPEVLNRAFEPFFSTRSRQQGLGLTVAEKVIRAHGGTVEAQSEAGKGTVITCSIPAGK